MLTADLVDARKKDGELLLRPFDREARSDALAIGRALLDAAHAYVGRSREELEEAWEAVSTDAAPKRFKLTAGLQKLVADACTFEAETTVDPSELRRNLFTRASAQRRTHEEGARFDRQAVLEETAKELGLTAAALEQAMFSDLRSEHVLRAAPTFDASSLVEAWELGQAQAVLLTAVRVTCEVAAASPGLLRELFAKLKFHQLLFNAERFSRPAATPAEGWRLVIDGPYSMFDAVTKYGLRLALAFPALRSLEQWSLVADIRWGKAREPLVFRLSSDPPAKTERAKQGSRPPPKLHLSDDVRQLMDGINALEGEWRARPCTTILEARGKGICIPDLELTRVGKKGKPVYVEVLGYWSRDAVWRRVELAEHDLGARIVFAVSSRLRVSAEVLDENAPASLYIYKGKMSPKAVVAQAARLER